MQRGQAVTAGAVIAGAVVLGAAGCSSGGGGGTSGGAVKAAEAPPPAITPANGTQQVQPDQPVTVQAKAGRLTEVTVADAKGGKAAGTLAADGKTWRTTWGLKPSTTYTVTAKGDADGKPVTATSTFTTLKPAKKLESGMSPLEGETVGVGMPVQLLLSRSVATKAARAAVERSLEVRMSTPVEGAWNWISDREVDFRPRTYWPSGEKVRVVAHLAGLKVADGVYGTKDRTLNFTVGPRHITKVDANAHEAVVTSGGSTVRTMKVSLGKPGDDSYSGTMIAQEKTPHMVMDSATTGDPGAYRTPTDWNVRLTYSGTFVHAAPWSVGSQGNANVSHGCVNASPTDAKWFYNFTNRGDVIQISGTTRKLRFGNGPTPWAKSWQDWLAGSALGKSVTGTKL
ncbi:putative L,D-transpeptidase LppS precursor [Actinomadura rubteroloni]|uniref:Putative L,D-transpeptidase LppS n=1 Tax=Actinomadura rubteroloni TaxID=1926885 RepID=A0A2P4UBA6_9ACTN|nr:Ig-like domain-containing protein [Actinomadura rubteroloni]POM22326.1 putative L,D-transpeptidase LppS precursor [Actinomadura rubteroloni]